MAAAGCGHLVSRILQSLSRQGESSPQPDRGTASNEWAAIKHPVERLSQRFGAAEDTVASVVHLKHVAVARAARVHRSFIHRHPQLHAAVVAAQQEPATPTHHDSTVSVASLHAELANLHAQNARLAKHITMLERRLSEALGAGVYRDSGLGAVDETPDLRRQLTELENRTGNLADRLSDREDELLAARAANRELMAELNRK